VFFGDGVRGRIPLPGSAIQSKQHRSGGGLAGNVAASTIKQLLGQIAGVQGAFNPRAAEGGADGETIERFSVRGPRTIRHRGRAISPSDYETLAREASPAVAVARAIATRNPTGQRLPGWVTLVIIPQSEEPRPWPSFGLRQHVLAYIEARAPADIVAADRIYITGPDYVSIDVNATLAPKNVSEAGIVEKRARQALEDFLHPLRGGPDRTGWEPGRDAYLSDVAAVLERVEGIDYVKDLALLVNGMLQDEHVTIADDRVVVAGKIRLRIEAAER
jgi:predicted phage baseplate assembly protein